MGSRRSSCRTPWATSSKPGTWTPARRPALPPIGRTEKCVPKPAPTPAPLGSAGCGGTTPKPGSPPMSGPATTDLTWAAGRRWTRCGRGKMRTPMLDRVQRSERTITARHRAMTMSPSMIQTRSIATDRSKITAGTHATRNTKMICMIADARMSNAQISGAGTRSARPTVKRNCLSV